MPKQVCVILSVCVYLWVHVCVFVCVCAENKMQELNSVSKVHWFLPPASFIPLRHFIDTVQMYSQYTGWWKPGWPCDLWTLSVACVRLLWLQHPGILLDSDLSQSLDLWYFKFSSLLYIFLSHWCVIYSTTLLHIDGFISFLSLFSCPLFIVCIPLYIPFGSTQTLLFICPPHCTTTLHCAFTLSSLPSSHRTPLPCIRFSSGI